MERWVCALGERVPCTQDWLGGKFLPLAPHRRVSDSRGETHISQVSQITQERLGIFNWALLGSALGPMQWPWAGRAPGIGGGHKRMVWVVRPS